MSTELPRLYTDLAPWYHLLTAPEEYDEEAAFYYQAFVDASATPLRTLLELGSGSGNMASHYKRYFESTLTDLSPQTLEISRALNPDCEHIQGDMRTLRLDRQFDAVFVHDAVMYLTTEDDLRQAIEAAFVHCRPGGVAVFAPDYVKDIYMPGTSHGGNDGDGRALRYLEWTWDPDPNDTTYEVEYVYVFREDGKPVWTENERHVEGLFSRGDWLRLLHAAGFRAKVRTYEHGEGEPGFSEIFVAVRPD